MRFLPNRNTINRLEGRLAELLGGASLKEWVEHSVIHLLQISNQVAPPTSLAKNLYQNRRIVSVKYSPKARPFWGRLNIGKSGFEIEIFRPKSSSVFWARYAFGHEIAHTFFYDLRKWPPMRLVYGNTLDIEFEWLCDYIAKALFVPEVWIEKELEKHPSFGDSEFSLDLIHGLERKFRVPFNIILERIVEDLEIWNCVILEFTKFPSLIVDSQPRSISRDEWRLTWYTFPISGTEGLYIPRGRKSEKGTRIYPKAKGRILDLLNSLTQASEAAGPLYKKIQVNSISSQTTGNLGKFLSRSLKSDFIDMYISYKSISQDTLFRRKHEEEKLICAFRCC